MYEYRRDGVIRRLHAYFRRFYRQGLVFLKDTEVMSRKILEARKGHESSLLKGMYWSIFALHLLQERFSSVINMTSEEDDQIDMDMDEMENDLKNNTWIMQHEEEAVVDDNTDPEIWDRQSTACFVERELHQCSRRSKDVADLDTDVLTTMEVDTVMRFLKTCMREFVIEDYMLMGFANSDDRRRFQPNISSTLLALNTYRVIRDTIKSPASLGFAKHMAWVYQVDDLLSFIRMLYEPTKGYYRKSFFPVLPESADIRHTASAVISTSVALRLSGCQGEYYRTKMEEWIDITNVTNHIIEHFNDDGGVALWPPTESHCGAAFCAVATLTILGTITTVPRKRLVALKGWLLKSLTQLGGVSGRVGKKEDVCYSFWLLATLNLLKRCGIQSQMLKHREMVRFIESCQTISGGVAPHPCDGNDKPQPDPFHSFAALMAITLIEEDREQSQTSVLDKLI